MAASLSLATKKQKHPESSCLLSALFPDFLKEIDCRWLRKRITYEQSTAASEKRASYQSKAFEGDNQSTGAPYEMEPEILPGKMM